MSGGEGSGAHSPTRAGEARNELRSSLTAVGIITALSIFVYLVRDILFPFVVAGILSYVSTPLVDRLHRRLPGPRWLYAAVVLLALMAVTALASVLAWPSLQQEMAKLGTDLHGSIDGLLRHFIGDGHVTILGETLSAQGIADKVADGARAWLQGNHFVTLAALGFAGMIGFILTWVLLGYFLIDAPRIRDGMFWLVPPHHRAFVHRVWADFDPILRRYFVGVGLVVVYATTVASIGLTFFLHLDDAIFLAVMTGLLEVVPVVGPLASGVIVGLAAVDQAQTSWDIIAYVIYAVILRVSIDEFFGPIVLGRAAYVPPVLVIFCFLSGGVLFGIVGIVLAVPVALMVKTSLYELYKDAGGAEA